jgi:ABC-type uncharacterized transport system substrate-binding protein
MKSNNSKISLKALIIMLLLIAGNLWAHPHIWIDYQLEPQFSEDGLQGIMMHWTFDEMFSWDLCTYYTADGDTLLSQTDCDSLYTNAFRYLAESDYFCHFALDGVDVVPSEVSQFSASFAADKVTYHFFVPWVVAATAEPQTLIISLYDESIYCDMTRTAVQPHCPAAIAVEQYEIDATTINILFTRKQ